MLYKCNSDKIRLSKKEAPQYFWLYELRIYEFYIIKKKCRTAQRYSTHYFLILNSIKLSFQASK